MPTEEGEIDQEEGEITSPKPVRSAGHSHASGPMHHHAQQQQQQRTGSAVNANPGMNPSMHSSHAVAGHARPNNASVAAATPGNTHQTPLLPPPPPPHRGPPPLPVPSSSSYGPRRSSTGSGIPPFIQRGGAFGGRGGGRFGGRGRGRGGLPMRSQSWTGPSHDNGFPSSSSSPPNLTRTNNASFAGRGGGMHPAGPPPPRHHHHPHHSQHSPIPPMERQRSSTDIMGSTSSSSGPPAIGGAQSSHAPNHTGFAPPPPRGVHRMPSYSSLADTTPAGPPAAASGRSPGPPLRRAMSAGGMPDASHPPRTSPNTLDRRRNSSLSTQPPYSPNTTNTSSYGGGRRSFGRFPPPPPFGGGGDEPPVMAPAPVSSAELLARAPRSTSVSSTTSEVMAAAAAAPSMSSEHQPLTCAHLGSPAEVDRAEKAIHSLRGLVSNPPQAKSSGSIVLPTKQLILKSVAKLDMKVKKMQREATQLQEELDKITDEEAASKRREHERLEQEQFAKEEEARRVELERIAKEQEFAAGRRRELQSRVNKMQQAFDVDVSREMEVLEQSIGNSVGEERSRREHEMKEQIRAATTMFDDGIVQARKDYDEALKAATAAAEVERAAKEAVAKEEGNLEPAVEVAKPDVSTETEPGRPASADLIASIYAENRRRAAEAHIESLSLLPYAPLPVTSSESTIGGKSNAEWTKLARGVSGLADALYTEPEQNPCFESNTQSHSVIEPLVKEYVRNRHRQLHQRWLELAEEYTVRNQLYNQSEHIHTKEKASGVHVVGGKDILIFGRKPSPSRDKPISSGGRSTTNPYRRARRGNDVVRSDYEQEQIIAELTAKEAMEKRIAHGGCTLPRQRCQVEKNLSVTYHKTFNSQRIFDPLAEAEQANLVNIWTDMEKCIFLDRFLQHPKDFKKIASYMKNKTTKQCIEFYYDSKPAVPYKQALKEHMMRRKRKGDYGVWDASIQAAMSMGATVTAGPNKDKPLVFALPESDCTYRTRYFHPLSRDIFDSINVGRLEVTEDMLTETKKGRSKKRSAHTLFSLNPEHRKFLKSSAQDSVSSAKGAIGAPSPADLSDMQDQHLTGTASPMRRTPQKWTAAERRIFLETLDKFGKNWSVLASAIGSKSITQIKNFYYDHKKQSGRQTGKGGHSGLGTVNEDDVMTDIAEPSSTGLDQYGLASSIDGRRSILSSGLNQESLQDPNLMTPTDLWNQAQHALLTQQQQHLAAHLSSQEARRLLQSQTHQQLLSSMSSIYPWASTAQLAALQQQQQAQEAHSAAREWADAATQMQNVLAMAHGHQGYTMDHSSHLRSMAMSGLVNPAMLTSNSAAMSQLDHHQGESAEHLQQSLSLAGLVGYPSGSSHGSATAASSASSSAVTAAALGLLAQQQQGVAQDEHIMDMGVYRDQGPEESDRDHRELH